jgi:hypothetical protein
MSLRLDPERKALLADVTPVPEAEPINEVSRSA